MEILKYKSFEGSAELDMDRKECHGRILYIDDVVTFRADDPKGLETEFRAAVDDYLETCASIGKEPEKSCRGMFNVRVSPEVHRAALRRAGRDGATLNTVVGRALEAYLRPIAEPKDGQSNGLPVHDAGVAHWKLIYAHVHAVGLPQSVVHQLDVTPVGGRMWEPQSSSPSATEFTVPSDVIFDILENDRVH